MLSIAINVKNGAKYLELCLNALHKFDDVVLLDNYSTDNTLEIAKSYTNVRVFQAEFSGMGNLRNIASGFCKHDWVFFVDSDEVVNQELVTRLLNLEFKNGNVYSILRHNYYAGKLVDSSAWENDWINRIYNRLETKYIEYSVHESINVSGMSVVKIENGTIYHFPYEKISELLDKTQFYSTLYAKQNLGKKRANLCMIPFRAIVMFIKCYILKGGVRDGYEGYVVSTFNAIGVLVKYFKLYELEHSQTLGIVINLDGLNLEEINLLITQINLQSALPSIVLFALNDKIINTFERDVRILIKSNLIIPYVIIQQSLFQKIKNATSFNDDGTINNDLQVKKLDYMIYFENYDLLARKDFVKICKDKISTGKIIKEVCFIRCINKN